MPIYSYKCECGLLHDVIHSYGEITEGLTDSTKEKMRLERIDNGCECVSELKRVITNCNIGEYNSADKAGKKRIIKEKAREQFAKEGKEQKHEIIKRTIKQVNAANGM